jgi:hypothetical protein
MGVGTFLRILVANTRNLNDYKSIRANDYGNKNDNGL